MKNLIKCVVEMVNGKTVEIKNLGKEVGQTEALKKNCITLQES